MFDSTKDILYIVIAFCVLWITVFLSWMFYYLTKILRNTSQIIEELRMKLHALTETVNYLRGRIEHLSSMFTLGHKGVGGYMKKMADKHAKKIVDESTEAMNKAAKDAVDKAFSSAADKISKTAKKIRK